jgi:hypothetical protein
VRLIEGKRTESVAPTLWVKQRSQLWPNVEAAEQFAAGQDFGIILAVGTGADRQCCSKTAAAATLRE